MLRLKRIGIATGVLTAAALSIALAVPAFADTGARNGDAVGVGSDTVQNVSDFLWDGAPGVAGGYNNIGNNNRVESFDATGDANGRAVYDGTCGAVTNAVTGIAPFCDSTTNQTPNLMAGSVVLRDGTSPVTRPNGSGAGIGALFNDTVGQNGYQSLPNNSIQFARMSRLPNSTELGECPTTLANCGGWHVYQVATDQLGIAHVSSGFNGPAAGLSLQQLLAIYTCSKTTWNTVPGGGTNTDTIHPLIPQSGSGTRNFFLADLATVNGGVTPTPGSCVRTVEEHDPTGIYGDPTPKDAIEPFSTGKIALINGGYFTNPGYSGTGFSDGAYTPGYLTTFPAGTSGDGNPVYLDTRGLYFTIRNADLTATPVVPFQTGGTQNFAQTLFSSPTSWIGRASNAALITAAGFTAAYKDCGVNPTSC